MPPASNAGALVARGRRSLVGAGARVRVRPRMGREHGPFISVSLKASLQPSDLNATPKTVGSALSETRRPAARIARRNRDGMQGVRGSSPLSSTKVRLLTCGFAFATIFREPAGAHSVRRPGFRRSVGLHGANVVGLRVC
jgi:hypothetical protein